MTTVKVRFDGRVFVPETPVNLPVGTPAEVALQVERSSELPTLAAEAQIAHQFPDKSALPVDLASQVDHYLYGTPKRP
jgi:hypothetical protein